jgi:hypothetical protein
LGEQVSNPESCVCAVRDTARQRRKSCSICRLRQKIQLTARIDVSGAQEKEKLRVRLTWPEPSRRNQRPTALVATFSFSL